MIYIQSLQIELDTPTTYKKWFAHLQLQKLQNPEQFEKKVIACVDELITIFEPKDSSSAAKQVANIDRNSRNQVLKNEHVRGRFGDIELVERKRDDGDVKQDVATIVGELVDRVG